MEWESPTILHKVPVLECSTNPWTVQVLEGPRGSSTKSSFDDIALSPDMYASARVISAPFLKNIFYSLDSSLRL